jgi:hypothetical protein
VLLRSVKVEARMNKCTLLAENGVYRVPRLVGMRGTDNMHVDTTLICEMAWLKRVSDLDTRRYSGDRGSPHGVSTGLRNFSKHIGHSRVETVGDMGLKECNGRPSFALDVGRNRWIEHGG